MERDKDAENHALVEALTGIARAEDRLAAMDDRSAEIDRRMRSADEHLSVQQGEAARADQEQRALEDGLRNLLAERDRLMGALREAITRHESAVADDRSATEALRGRRELRETRRARLESLRELLGRGEDVGDGVRHLMGLDPSERSGLGLRGLVRDAFEVEPSLERAVEAVLAERAEGAVLERGADPLEALRRLRSADVGRGVFVLEREDDSPHGFVPLGEPLATRVTPRPGFERIANTLVGRVNVVDDLGEALSLYGTGRIPCTFVTPAGDVLTPDGVVRGGGADVGSGILGRVREMRELEAEVASLDQQVDEQQSTCAAAEAQVAAAHDELENLRNRHHTAALAVANHEKDLERTRERVKAIGEAQEGRVAERSELLNEVEALGGERVRIDGLLGTHREDRALRQRTLDGLLLQIGSAGRELSRLEAVVTERRVQHEGREEACERLRASLERTDTAIAETRDWVQRREAEIHTAEERREALAGSIAQAETTLAERLREEELARHSNEEKRDAYEGLAATVRGLEEEARGVRIELESQRDESQQAELGLREMELRLTHLEDGIRDKWNLDLAQWKPPRRSWTWKRNPNRPRSSRTCRCRAKPCPGPMPCPRAPAARIGTPAARRARSPN